ncbi:PREDICTED: uncharacterized protein LOC109232348 [Nicotiana attenuata]|uniref:Agenet domain-containing protein n=1 Tax=Nicotiana attenuata TaxID=49451 RepID=A0A1J6I2X0_NICAT|nr:PREDICTED: uncharacterized protein LOC109232348 [Nicotiana attenuata]XP_019253628.1 PREDICTED: uncharacterized protein LOC109232348 [Nicotiana attenuata]OIS98867.1 hypothetical protein A4A49_15594 [Nicotiana attenuata]
MDQRYQLPFKAGQSAEARSFEVGYRGAWFRCKIKEISCRGGHWKALLEYFDYPDEKLTWTELYQVPPYQSGKSKEIRQLILRPEYPPTHLKSQVSDVSSTSDVTIVTDGTWKAGDLVDWWTADCYWSGKLTKLLGNGKAEIELVPPPLGEGATYEVFVKDLRPSVDWSPEFGWAVPASLDGENRRRYARLLKPVSQAPFDVPSSIGHAMCKGRRDSQATTGSSSNSSLSTRLSGNSLPNEKRDLKTTEFVQHSLSVDDSTEAVNRTKDTLNQTTSYSSSSTHSFSKSLPALDEKRGFKSKGLMEQPPNAADSKEAATTSKQSIWSGSDSVSPIGVAAKSAGPTDKDLKYFHCPLKKFKTSGEIRLNSMESDSVEAAILDLEELANKISWLKRTIECGRSLSDAVRPSWEFVEHNGTFTKK